MLQQPLDEANVLLGTCAYVAICVIKLVLPLRETILALMLGLPAHHLDREEPEARRARLQIVANAIADASQRATCSDDFASDGCRRVWPKAPLDLSVLLVTQAYSESRFARNVHEGKCRSYECDPIRNASTGVLQHRARTLWQIHRIGPIETEWDIMLGVDAASTAAAAWAATKILSRGYRACGSVSGAMARYAGIDSCTWSEAAKRGRLFEGLRRKAIKLESSAGDVPNTEQRVRTRTSMR